MRNDEQRRRAKPENETRARGKGAGQRELRLEREAGQRDNVEEGCGKRARTPRKPPRRLPPEVLQDDEVRALMHACGGTPTGIRNRALIAILYRAGLRIGEALALHPRDVNLGTGEIRVLHGKGDRFRIVGIDPGATPMIEAWLEMRARMRTSTPQHDERQGHDTGDMRIAGHTAHAARPSCAQSNGSCAGAARLRLRVNAPKPSPCVGAPERDPWAVAPTPRYSSGTPLPVSAPLFCTREGGPIADAYIRRLMKRLAAKAGLDRRVHAHGLRHTHAAQLRAEGIDIGIVSKQLGHRSILTTIRYLDHIAPVQVVKAMRGREWDQSGEV